MYKRKRITKTGKPSPRPGVRLVRKRKFEPILETESGVRVRSKYEKRCADFLYLQNISFQYEPLILLAGKQYRPDYYLPQYNLFLEICGYGHMPYYTDRVSFKKKIYEEHKMKAVFIFYNGKGSLEKLLQEELSKYKIPFDHIE
jgi:DNA helicase IV